MRNTFLIRLATLSIALGGLWLALTQQPPAQPLTVEKIADDLHMAQYLAQIVKAAYFLGLIWLFDLFSKSRVLCVFSILYIIECVFF